MQIPDPSPTRGSDARMTALPLHDLHLTPDEDRIYRDLLRRRSGWPIWELAEHTGMPGPRVTAAMAGLEGRGLVTHRGRDTDMYVARPPAHAFNELLTEHEQLISRARRRMEELTQLYESRSTIAADVVDVVVGAASITRHFDHMQRLARHRVRGCDRPPYPRLRAGAHPVERERIAAGVEYRIIYDPVVLTLPDGLSRLRDSAAAGEDIRMLTELPIKLAIADDQLALIALGATDGDPSALLVHPSVLLDGLIAVFDTLWRFATPMRTWTDDEATSGFSDADRRLLGLLAAGVTEETMARRLDVSLRTVQRRTQVLMEALGASTRFQAGVAAAKRGLL